ncbi:MAG TPA: DUF4968 domain-containing protein, partial [Pyrinomonadaceae bacterium]|nr:DUF4968 domain-containing protein [Pyrinomonadaceae bacterium]
MKKLFIILAFLGSASAQDITPLEKIGPITRFERSATHVTFHCADNSQVRLSILAPDLIRVRASFTKPIPAKDHSWAIAKDDWQTPRWTLQETPDSITIT